MHTWYVSTLWMSLWLRTRILILNNELSFLDLGLHFQVHFSHALRVPLNWTRFCACARWTGLTTQPPRFNVKFRLMPRHKIRFSILLEYSAILLPSTSLQVMQRPDLILSFFLSILFSFHFLFFSLERFQYFWDGSFD